MDDFEDDDFDESAWNIVDQVESTFAQQKRVNADQSSNKSTIPRHDPKINLANSATKSTALNTDKTRSNDSSKQSSLSNHVSVSSISSPIIDLSNDLDFDEVFKTVEAAEKQYIPVKQEQKKLNPIASTSRVPIQKSTMPVNGMSGISNGRTTGVFGRQANISTNAGTSSSSAGKPSMRQLNLFGETVSTQSSQGVLIQANKANSAIAPASQSVAQRARDMMANILAIPEALPSRNGDQEHSSQYQGKTKQWDFNQPLNKPKTAYKPDPDDFDFDDFADVELDQALAEKETEFDLPPPPLEPQIEGLKQMKVQIDREAAKTWVYPTNKEKRDYQFNIVQRALFNNVLVALPTGLGKTFIAAVVILNYFRWFPDGKIIFVAPTKPLVAQQQIACHGICGLPWDTAVEMTGEKKATYRAEEWKSKRIFYMTPQTFENDLFSTAINAEDVVCVVVDEAHRATGNYSYTKVIRQLMQRNSFFRVLALTATPGSTPDKVQEVVDNLHINLIEIRQEDALDIRKYVHAKDEDPVVIPLSGVVADLRNLMGRLMKPHLDILIGAGVMNARDPASLSGFAVNSILRDPRKKSVVQTRKLYSQISDLATLSRAMEVLIKYSVTMFAEKILEIQTGRNKRGTKASTARQQVIFQGNTVMQEMRKLYETCQDEEGFVPHPKMDYLQNVIASHFAQDEENRGGSGCQTRVMVFCSLRDCVTEIVALLNRVPSVKATQFVGQATDKKGNKGLRQKDQERIVEEFKKGDYNVLVATSIGEEGLDIGEVDLIVCYEAVKNAVRMLQRVGRTGRKREGRIVVLMAEGPEEKNWQQSKDQYKTVQHDIIKGINLSLYDDVERLVPPDITSEVRFEEVDQPPFEPSMIRNQSSKRKAAGTTKRKARNTDPMRNVPEGALTTFVTVSKMRKGKGKQAPEQSNKKARVSMRAGESSEDEVLNSRSNYTLPELESSSDDSDADLERGLVLDSPSPPPVKVIVPKTSSNSSSSSHLNQKVRGRTLGSGRPRIPINQSGSSSTSGDDLYSRTLNNPPIRNPLIEAHINHMPNETANQSDIKSLDDTESSSPIIARRRPQPHPLIAKLADMSTSVTDPEDDVISVSGTESSEDDDDLIRQSALAETRKKKRTFKRRINPDSSIQSPTPVDDGIREKQMRPPPVPKRSKPKKASTSSYATGKRKRTIGGSPTSRKLFQMEADRSTDEEVHGERDENDELDDRYQEDSSDREHVGDFMPTQAPRGYKQQAIYLQSLNTQTAPTPFRRTTRNVSNRHSNGESRTPASHDGGRSRSRQNLMTSSNKGESDNEYEVGSFICSDEEIVYESGSQGQIQNTWQLSSQ